MVEALPEDGATGTLVGRVWVPAAGGRPAGPSAVSVREDGIYDLSAIVATCSELIAADDPVALSQGKHR